LAQADDDTATKIFHDFTWGIAWAGLMRNIATEVDRLCGPKCPSIQRIEFLRTDDEFRKRG
jgi:hypothetical protein